jgi:hypothetical protein
MQVAPQVRQHPGARSDWLESNMEHRTASTSDVYVGRTLYARRREAASDHPWLDDMTELQRNDYWQRYMAVVNATGTLPAPEAVMRIVDRVLASNGAPVIPLGRPVREGEQQVVYYLRFADRVKIGTTSDLARRCVAIPHDEVLGSEPGGYDLEQKRHRQFADLHVIGEWFRYDEPLRSHVASLQSSS